MSKRQREEDQLLVTIPDLQKYVEELEWIIVNVEASGRCETPGCWRLVAKEAWCKDCMRAPTRCILCEPNEFGHCEPHEECGDSFCKLHGDIAGEKCDECREHPED